MPRYHYSQIAVYDAKGGPAKEVSYPGDANKATPTRAGRFVVSQIEKHVSQRRYLWSAVPWGTPLRVSPAGKVEIQLAGKWQLLTEVPSWKEQYKNNQTAVRKDLEDLYAQMIQPLKGYLKSVGRLPATWIFNDFGHVSVKYFVDTNQNFRRDKNESVLSDFIHTTPGDELYTWFNRTTPYHVEVNLSSSHGCIHLRPADIDKLLQSGYLKIGAVLEVHSYTERPRQIFDLSSSQLRKTRTEVHFFPGEAKMVVYAVSPMQ